MGKQSQFRVYNFEFGTIKETNDTVKFEMDRNQFTHDKIADISNTQLANSEEFLSLVDVKESDTQVIFQFNKSAKLTNLAKIKSEAYPVKISIAQEILEQDILGKYTDYYVSLNPATMYYHPMQTVRYTYFANRFMPKDQYTSLERYKACVVSLLSGISYEKCLVSPEEVKQEGNELIKEIYNQPTRADLLRFIKDSEDYITYDYISNNNERERKNRNKYLAIIATLGLVAIGGIIFTQVNASSSQMEIVESYEQQLTEKDTLMKANEAFANGNYEEAIQLYKQIDYDLADVLEELAKQGQYQLAIDTEESSLETVIQQAYEADNLQAISDLNSDKLTEEAKGKLTDEQTIISEDQSGMENVLNFLNDKNTAERLALKYVELGNVDKAKQVQEKYPENTVIAEAVIQGEEADKKRKDLQQEIDDLNKEKDGLNEEDNTDRIDEINKRIDELNKQIDELVNEGE
ncbi:hypothetical protein ACEN4K_05515 [Marinilactibacillus psychrotolerans]|uniref:hypothetical protein n=2 Tax=Carnobacteriaceae TaxID=186828 RepID=UPI003884567B